MHQQRRHHHAGRTTAHPVVEKVAAAYNGAGDDYVAYADGDADQPFVFKGVHAYADRRIWEILAAKLADLRAGGARSVTILDAGCGPGTWLRRLVTHARDLGFREIHARGFDIADVQIRAARRLSRGPCALPGVNLSFGVASLEEPFPEGDRTVDITLCLYSVFNHLPSGHLSRIAREIARVTRGHFVTTVRPVGSMPTVTVDAVEKARHLKLNHRLDRFDAELSNGRHVAMPFHLFTPCELRKCFESHFEIADLCGLDIFHSRFAPDHRWNPASLTVQPRLEGELADLEDTYARIPGFMERANHLLLVGRRRAA